MTLRRALALGAVVTLTFAASLLAPPAAVGAGVAGYSLTALAAGVRFQLNSPGFLPLGDPAEGNVAELDVPLARTSISQGPLINAIASPAYPGDTVAHLGTAIGTFAPEFGVVPNYPVVAEANYPPTPLHGGTATFSQGGIAEGSAMANADGAKVVANTVSQSIGGVIDIASSMARNELSVTATGIRSSALSTTGRITIAGVVAIDGVVGTAEASSNGATAEPKAQLSVGKVTVAGQDAYIDRDGVHVAANPSLGAGVVAGLQQMVNGVLNTDGISIRTIAPVTKVDKAAASASAGALAITIDRVIPSVAVPGVPALDIPGVYTLVLGTPDLPTHIEVLIGEARVGANATSLLPFDAGVTVPTLDVGGESLTDGGDFSSITGPGTSLGGALSPPSQAGQSDLAFQPAAERGSGRGIPIGFVIFGVFVAFAISGPLLGYARWQLLEGRHR